MANLGTETPPLLADVTSIQSWLFATFLFDRILPSAVRVLRVHP